MPRKPIGEKAMADAERQARTASRARPCAGDPHPSPGRPSQSPALAGRRRPALRAASAVCRLARSAACQPTRQRAGRGPPGYLRTRSLRTRERRAPTRLRTRLTFQRRTLKTSQRVAPSGSQTPGLTTGATPPAVHPRGPTGTPRATRRQPRGGRVATRGSPLWTPGMNRSR